jgi:hypothetical protein
LLRPPRSSYPNEPEVSAKRRLNSPKRLGRRTASCGHRQEIRGLTGIA